MWKYINYLYGKHNYLVILWNKVHKVLVVVHAPQGLLASIVNLWLNSIFYTVTLKINCVGIFIFCTSFPSNRLIDSLLSLVRNTNSEGSSHLIDLLLSLIKAMPSQHTNSENSSRSLSEYVWLQCSGAESDSDAVWQTRAVEGQVILSWLHDKCWSSMFRYQHSQIWLYFEQVI